MDQKSNFPKIEDSQYLLQHFDIDKKIILSTLLAEHYADVYRLGFLLLNDENRAEEAVRRTFILALQNHKRFKGQSSPKIWLFSLLVRICVQQGKAAKQLTALLPDRLISLDREKLIPIVLLFLDGLKIEEISSILNVPIKIIRSQITSEIQKTPGFPSTGILIDHKVSLDSIIDLAIHNQFPNSSLERDHLGDCNSCNQSAADIKRWAQEFSKELSQVWPIPEVSPNKIAHVVQLITETQRHTESSQINKRFPFIWGISIVLFLLLVSWLSAKINSENTITKFFLSQQPPNFNDLSSYLGDPYISADGGLIVYTKSTFRENLTIRDVYLFNKAMATHTLISKTTDQIPGDDDSFSPAITNDGKLVVFASHASNLEGEDSPICESRLKDKSHCSNIFLVDNEKNTLTHVSKPTNAEGSTGDSFSPVISSDGNWVAFWSSSRNLHGADDLRCNDLAGEYNCLDIFIYNVRTKDLSHVPIGRHWNENPGTFFLNFSGKGNLLLLTLSDRDLIGEQLDLKNNSDVFIYNQSQESFEAVNITETSEIGNKSSYSGALSENGRYVIFTSSATNLTSPSTRGYVNVFLRDRFRSLTKILSTDQVNAGILNPNDIKIGENIAISPDGSWAAYISRGKNILDDGIPWWCKIPSNNLITCSTIVLQNLVSGENIIIIDKPTPNSAYSNLRLTNLGASLLFNEYSVDCKTCGMVLWQYNNMTGDIFLIKHP